MFFKKIFKKYHARRVAQSIEKRASYKAGMISPALEAVHTEECVFLPDRAELLRRLPRRGTAAEIGAAFGDYTAEILSENQPAVLHLVDLWGSERYRQGLQRIETNFAGEIGAGKLVINQGLSTDVLKTFSDGYFDWVYIDTDHSYQNTWDELNLCASKVKASGYIAGHDFCTGNVVAPVPYGVIEACNRFCVEKGWRYSYIAMASDGHMSFCLSRIQ